MTVEALEKIEKTNLEFLHSKLPEYIKDVDVNLSNVFQEDPATGLSLNQIHGIALASAYAIQDPMIIAAIEGESSATLSPEQVIAAKNAATVMAMNNLYYGFTGLAEDDELSKMQTGLRMTAIGTHGIEKVDFELYALAVSAINKCQYCIKTHVKKIENAGISKQGIQHCIKIAAVLLAARQALKF